MSDRAFVSIEVTVTRGGLECQYTRVMDVELREMAVLGEEHLSDLASWVTDGVAPVMATPEQLAKLIAKYVELEFTPPVTDNMTARRAVRLMRELKQEERARQQAGSNP